MDTAIALRHKVLRELIAKAAAPSGTPIRFE